MTPLIMLVGKAGSGKDTVASMIAANWNAVIVAMADPMKRFAADALSFSEEQLWGPSETRNALDSRFAIHEFRQAALSRVKLLAYQWPFEVLPTKVSMDGNRLHPAHKALVTWADDLMNQAREDKGLTPRKALQTLGTQWGRESGKPDMWIEYAQKRAFKLLAGGFEYDKTKGLIPSPKYPGYHFAVITDGRFRNEVLRVKEAGGVVFRIDCPQLDTGVTETAGVAGHSSEAEQKSIPDHWFDAIIDNNKKLGLDSLRTLVDEAMEFNFRHPIQFTSVNTLWAKK